MEPKCELWSQSRHLEKTESKSLNCLGKHESKILSCLVERDSKILNSVERESTNPSCLANCERKNPQCESKSPNCPREGWFL